MGQVDPWWGLEVRIPWRWVLALGWLVILSLSAYERLIPASAYMQVRSVHVDDTTVGIAPIMLVDRTIHADFTAVWRADVERKMNNGRYVQICTSGGLGNYATDNDLPDPLDLDWWTYPIKCAPTVAGKYRIETTWTITLPGGLTKEVRVLSNTFEVRS